MYPYLVIYLLSVINRYADPEPMQTGLQPLKRK